MKKNWKQILILLTMISVLVLPYFVFASADPLGNLQNVASGNNGPYAEAGEGSIIVLISSVVSAFLSILGIIFIILIIYAGYHYMTARGEEAKVEKAQDTLRRAIIGLIIIVGAYAIQAFIFAKLLS